MLNTLITLPDPLKALLLIAITFVVTELLKLLGNAIKVDLSGYTAQIASAVVASILVVVNALFAKIPLEYEPVVTAVLNLIIVLLGSWGTYKVFRQLMPKKILKKK
jgi:FtsH-binding integral membrane protein